MNEFLAAVITAVILSFVFAVVLLIFRAIQIKCYKKNIPVMPKRFTVTAHTGCLGTVPNTVSSMEKGVESGADIVEFDLNFDKNGEPVLSHNEPEEGAVHLREAFKFLSEHKSIKANVDVKDTSNLGAVLKYAEEYGVTDRIFFTGIFAKDVSAVERLCPNIPFYLNYSVNSRGNSDIAYISHIVETVQNCGAVGININYKSASKQLARAFKDEGLLVSLWTVNGKCGFCKALKLRPDNITTKRPDILCKMLGKTYNNSL